MDEIKDSSEGPIVYRILGAVGLTPPPIEKRVVDMFSVEGLSRDDQRSRPARAGVHGRHSPVRAVLVWAPTSGSVGMSVSIFSYRGRGHDRLMVDAAVVPTRRRSSTRSAPELDQLGALSPAPRSRRKSQRTGSAAAAV